jgi:hypothetical protein
MNPKLVESDGADLWVANSGGATVTRVRASDGSVLGTWTFASFAFGVLVARSRIYVTGNTIPGSVYVIEPASPPAAVGVLSNTLGNGPTGITTDGTSIWTANQGGSVSKVNPDTGAGTNITTGFSQPSGILFDGANIWVTDAGDNKLKKLDALGNVLQSVPMGLSPDLPVFDGSNIWVPNVSDNSVTVVRARDGIVLATLTGNGLNGPFQAAFDGQRILVINGSGMSVSLWKVADLTPIGFASTVLSPFGACSDGINFWITLSNGTQGTLARF